MTDQATPLHLPVHCPQCGFKVFDGLVIRARIIRAFPKGSEAKCKCKRWVELPFYYRLAPNNEKA